VKAVGHVDADTYYVSAERVRNLELREKPVAVLGNQGACVIAKSREMKACGVKTGMPIWEALPLCPDAIYVKRDFRWYEVLSRMMLAVVQEFSTRVEYYSIDEFFFEATPREGMDHLDLALMVRDGIQARVGVPVTVGIARSRTLAKLVSDTAKPFGAVAVLDRASEESLLAALPVTDITGIAGRREKRLMPWGIGSCLDFANADRRLIRRLLTATGEALWWELNGDPVRPIHPRRPMHKALARGGSLGAVVTDPMQLYAWLVRNLERLIEELRYHEVRPGRVTLWVSYRRGDFRVAVARPAPPTDRFDLLLDALRPCLRRCWIPRAAAERMHLIADQLTPRAETQLGLFDPPGRADRVEAVARLKGLVNERHGRFALRSAATLPLTAIYRDPSNAFDICDVRGKICY
jgi:nucleotidyltransferase/DNA polymerase involved in DNA repair